MKLIGLVGKKQSGKDTVCSLINIGFGCNRIAFADELKQELADALGSSIEKLNENKSKILIRRLLQDYGTEKRLEDPDYWIKKAAAKLDSKKLNVITDVRYPNEAAWIEEQGGSLIRIRRKETDDIEDNHSSETELEHIHCHGFINNDWGLDRLRFMTYDTIKTIFPKL